MRRTAVLIITVLAVLVAGGCGAVPVPWKTRAPAEPGTSSSTADDDASAGSVAQGGGIEEMPVGETPFAIAPLAPGDVVPLPPPADVLGEGIPVSAEPIDVATLDALVGDPEPDGVWGVPYAFLAAWYTASTTGDTAPMRRLAPECGFCTRVVERIEDGTDDVMSVENGYGVSMTLWPIPQSWSGGEGAIGMAMRGVVVIELPADGPTPHLHVVQDETIAIDLDVALVDGAWRIEDARTWAWETAVDPGDMTGGAAD